ncbi:MAG: hypothetical protein V4671_01590 [Armatimonadota bacterium]
MTQEIQTTGTGEDAPTTEGREQPEQTEEPHTRYPCRLPIRMTQAERAIIGKKACALNLSISRYLVENGVGDKQKEDPARLRYLQLLFQDAADKAKSLLASPLFTPKDELTRDVRARLEESAYLLRTLAGELARRLP